MHGSASDPSHGLSTAIGHIVKPPNNIKLLRFAAKQIKICFFN
jgi:hypothetical protein